MGTEACQRERGPEYFKIGQVAKLLGLTPSAVRFYSTRFFPYVRPVKTKTQRHVFRRRDVQVLKVIMILRHKCGLSVRQSFERLQELLVTYDQDLSAIEQALLASQSTVQAELDLASSRGLRESASPALESQSPKRQEEYARMEQELAEAYRARNEYFERMREAERTVTALRLELQALRKRITQAVNELLLEVDQVNP